MNVRESTCPDGSGAEFEEIFSVLVILRLLASPEDLSPALESGLSTSSSEFFEILAASSESFDRVVVTCALKFCTDWRTSLS